MLSSKKKHPSITNVNNSPIDSLIQSIINDAAKKVDDEQASPSVCCSVCQEEDDEYNDAAVEFCQECQIQLCDGHAALHQQANNHLLVPVDQAPKYQEHYIKAYQNLEIRLIPEKVIDYIMMTLMDVKVLHYLKCDDSKWRSKIEQYVKKCVPMFKFVAKFGSKGRGNGEFKNSQFVTTDKQGNIYVSDTENDKIRVFNNKGQWKQSIGSKGITDGEFSFPMGIAFNSKIYLIVADYSNQRIQIFNENLQFINLFGSWGEEKVQFKAPSGIVVDTDDNIIVADSNNHRIQMLDQDGNWKQSIGKYGIGDGELCSPWDVAVCKTDGRIFVSDKGNHRIQAFDATGRFLFKFGSEGEHDGQFRSPCGLALSHCNNYLFVCDKGNHRIQVFNAMNGAFMNCHGTKGSRDREFKSPRAVCVSLSGQIIVSEAEWLLFGTGNQHRIQIFK
jgi:DNA-binding beta-propeller fold protein YncE